MLIFKAYEDDNLFLVNILLNKQRYQDSLKTLQQKHKSRLQQLCAWNGFICIYFSILQLWQHFFKANV